jgi:hypothetical protein
METVGFVGTVEVETVNASRLWFSLTERKDQSDWIKIGPVRAWFTMNLESEHRPSHLAQLSLIMESMRSGHQVEVSHGGVASFDHGISNDTFEVDGIRVLRAPLRF